MRTLVAAAVGALLAVPAIADERIDRLEAEIAYLKDNARANRKEIAESQATLAKVGELAGRTRLKADFRYRHEQIDDASQATDRLRHRVRVRVGIEAKVNDTVKAVVQLATAGDDRDPRSTNQTLGEGATRKGVGLDLAYADWAPAQGVNVQLGKIPYAWQRVGSHFWDGDITWEGGAARLARGPFFASAFGAWLAESGSGADSRLLGGQLGARADLRDGVRLTGAIGYFDVGSVQDEVTLASGAPACTANKAFFGGAQGNRTIVVNGCRRLRDDYDLVEALAQVDLKLGTLPLALFADYLRNLDAIDNDTGYAFGVTLGKAGEPKSWELGVVYQRMEQNAQFGQFVDSDFGGGTTFAKGAVLKAAWVPAKNWTLNGTYFLNERVLPAAGVVTETWHDYERLQLDLNYRF
ncbi:MAG: putative porin [Steroidobacteraceae bacterium]